MVVYCLKPYVCPGYGRVWRCGIIWTDPQLASLSRKIRIIDWRWAFSGTNLQWLYHVQTTQFFETKSMQLKCIYSWYEVPLLKAASQVRMCHMDWSTWIFWKEHGHNADKKCIANLTWKANEARLCVFNSKSIGLYVLNCFRTCVIETLGAAVPLYLWVNGQSRKIWVLFHLVSACTHL